MYRVSYLYFNLVVDVQDYIGLGEALREIEIWFKESDNEGRILIQQI
jgi:hypothetical protein